MYQRPRRFAEHLAAFKDRGVAAPEEYRETIEQWAQMEARRIGDSILAMPRDHRREAVDVYAGPFREVLEREIHWLYQMRKTKHEQKQKRMA